MGEVFSRDGMLTEKAIEIFMNHLQAQRHFTMETNDNVLHGLKDNLAIKALAWNLEDLGSVSGSVTDFLSP